MDAGNSVRREEDLTAKCRAIEERAESLFAEGVAWTTFYRELLGRKGLVRRLFPSPEEWSLFEETPTYKKIQEMLASLRRAQEGQTTKTEAVSVITLRIPKSLHDALIDEAHNLRTSINRLCISKLAQLIDARWVPPARHLARHLSEGEEAGSTPRVPVVGQVQGQAAQTPPPDDPPAP